MTAISFVRDLNMSLAPKLKIGSYFLYSPAEDEDASEKQKKIKPYPVQIVDGQYLDPENGRVSNFWDWRRVMPGGRLSRTKECGYGGDEPLFKKIVKASALKLARLRK